MFLRSSTDERIITFLVTSEMLTCEILSSMHHVLKITSSAKNTLVHDLLPLPSTNDVTYVHARTCHQPPGVVLCVIYVEADLHRVYCCCIYAAPRRTAVFFTQLLIDVIDFFFERTGTHHVASDAHVQYSPACVILIYFSSANTLLLVPDFLPLPIHQRLVRTCRQPADLM